MNLQPKRPRPTQPTTTRTRSADIEQTVLDAATRLLATGGSEALSIRRIAAEAGVAPMSVYNRFGSKQGVLDHLFIRGFRALDEAMSAEQSGDLEKDLVENGLRYRAFALENPTRYELMFMRGVADYEASDEAATTATKSFLNLVEMVTHHQSLGSIPAGDHVVIAQQIWVGVHGVVSLELMGIGFVEDQEMLIRQLCRTMARGLRGAADPGQAATTEVTKRPLRRTASKGART
jgi:AcrR family transcriptional regulator